MEIKSPQEIDSPESCSSDSLIIVGSGNVAVNIYKIAAILGYRITVIDYRPETLNRERFPEASELLLGDIVEILGTYNITEDTSIVLVTHAHKFDEPALEVVIRSPARYVGVLGNKRKVTAYVSQLNSLGIPEELIARIHMPIGLDLGGQKAAEIALSAMAEIQAVKYGRSGGFLIVKQASEVFEVREELF